MVMDATSLSLLINPCLTYPTSFILGVNVCRLLPVSSWKSLSFQPKNVSSSTSATNSGSTSSRRKSVFGRAFKEDEFSAHSSSSNKSSNREKLIELFKRIQIKISEGESGSGDYGKNWETFSDDDSSVEKSVLEFLQQSNKRLKGKNSNLKCTEESNHKRRTTKKEKPIPAPQPPSTTKFTRPHSNFVKKSPIPSPTSLQSNEIVVNYSEDSSLAADKESSKIEGMKLSELKELAKQRGIRGYSKLKKSELVQLLKS